LLKRIGAQFRVLRYCTLAGTDHPDHATQAHVAAVQPKPSFAPFFENQPSNLLEKGCVKGGSDGRRTSDPLGCLPRH